MQFLKRSLKPIVLFVLCLSTDVYSQKDSAGKLVIDSNAEAAVFAPGVVSTSYPEWSPTFTPNGKTVYFVQGSIYWTIVTSIKLNGKRTAISGERLTILMHL